MKGNRELDELLISYILKELSAEEEAFVKEQINSDDKSRQHLMELQNAWKLLTIKQELDKVDVESEWGYFEKAVAREKQKLISIKKQQAFEESIVQEEEQKTERRSTIRKVMASVAIAASLITLIALVWVFSTNRQQSQLKVSRVDSGKTNQALSITRHEINTSGKSRKLLLQDGSEIVLFNKSEVSFEEPFTGSRRDITLKGKADFKVAKDKTKPFTVYSLALTTTALGTHFTVSAFENAENISVKLYEGKVVVKSAAYVQKKLGDYYLSPGQELIYNNKKYTAQLLNFNLKNPVLQDNGKTEVSNDDPLLPENTKGSWNMFNNQPLGQVFDQLQTLYNTEIIYSKKQVHKIYFIGKFDKSDSLYTILSQIASLNNLKVSKKNNRFIITK